MLFDKYGNNVNVLTNSSMVSHYCWINSNQIVVYMRDFELGENYYLLDVLSGNRNLISINVIKNLGDGHPSFFSNFLFLIHIPNKARMAMLYLYNINNCSLQIIGEFFFTLKFSGESRCDLHPRWSQNDKSIFIDTVYSGKRKLINIKIDSLFN
jgi:Tol biopolymer transport system component